MSNAPFDRSPIEVLRLRAAESVDSARVAPWKPLLAAALVVAGLGYWAVSGSTSPDVDVEAVLPRATVPQVSAPVSSQPGESTQVVVQVAGAVQKPGVYHLRNGARVIDAVAEAGGLASDADDERLNQAAKVTDGQRVYVVRKGQQAPPGEVGSSSPASVSEQGPQALVDLNTATASELDSLPGVGPATAQAILNYRTEKGPFRSVADLGKVKGIGPAKLAELRDRVRV